MNYVVITIFVFIHAGNKERHMSLIDTIGFDDPERDADADIIAELVDKLKNKCDHVNLIAIVVNGTAPRFDKSLVSMVRVFQVSYN